MWSCVSEMISECGLSDETSSCTDDTSDAFSCPLQIRSHIMFFNPRCAWSLTVMKCLWARHWVVTRFRLWLLCSWAWSLTSDPPVEAAERRRATASPQGSEEDHIAYSWYSKEPRIKAPQSMQRERQRESKTERERDRERERENVCRCLHLKCSCWI